VRHFEIERAGPLLNDWQTIGSVTAKGNTLYANDYNYKDKTNAYKAYYRLKIIDFDNYSEYSEVILIKRNISSFQELKIYPNPNLGRVNLSFLMSQNQKVGLIVTDILGKKIKEIQINAKEGFNRFAINLNSLEEGIYFLTIRNGIIQNTNKIILKDE
jgi:hypothetical protein